MTFINSQNIRYDHFLLIISPENYLNPMSTNIYKGAIPINKVEI